MRETANRSGRAGADDLVPSDDLPESERRWDLGRASDRECGTQHTHKERNRDSAAVSGATAMYPIPPVSVPSDMPR